MKVRLKQDVTLEQFNKATFGSANFDGRMLIDLELMKNHSVSASISGYTIAVLCKNLNNVDVTYDYDSETRHIWEVVEE